MSNLPSRATLLLYRFSTLLLVAAVAFSVFLAIGAVFGFGLSGDDVAVRAPVALDRVADLPAGAIGPDHVDIVVRVRDATGAQLRWAAARDLAPSALVAGALVLIRALLRSVRDGDAFTPSNVGRLRMLALVVLIGVPFATAVSSLCGNELADSAGLDSGGLAISLPGGAFLAGVSLLVLTEVFARGVHLQDEVEGTV